MSSARGIKLLRDLLDTIHILNRDGIRGKTFQVWNGPTLLVDLLADRNNGSDKNSKAEKRKKSFPHLVCCLRNYFTEIVIPDLIRNPVLSTGFPLSRE
jgi:hypothetical protein